MPGDPIDMKAFVYKRKFLQYLKAKIYGRRNQTNAFIYHWLVCVHSKIKFFLYLKHGEGEWMSKVVMGGQQHFAVVSVQIHARQQVQLGVHPVETSVGQIWQRVEKR